MTVLYSNAWESETAAVMPPNWGPTGRPAKVYDYTTLGKTPIQGSKAFFMADNGTAVCETSIGSRGDQAIRFATRVPSLTSAGFCSTGGIVRAVNGDGASTDSCYRVFLETNGTGLRLSIYWYAAGSALLASSSSYSFTPAASDILHFEARAVGSVIEGRVWRNGTARPDTISGTGTTTADYATVTATDTHIASGYTGIYFVGANVWVPADQLVITDSTGGEDFFYAVDTTAPVLSSPTGTKIDSTTASGSVTTNEGAGTLYRLASTNATETAATIKAANLTTAVTATGAISVSFTGLSPNTTYYAHYVQDDAASPANTSIVANSTSFTTDALPAAVLSSPIGTATSSTSASATVSTTIGSGTLYYMFSTNATETATTIKAAFSKAVSASGTQNVSVTGLTPSTAYYSHFVQVANAQDSNVVNGTGFSTPSNSAPVLSSPSGSATGITTATATVSTNTASGTLYTYASVNVTETAATVKASGVQTTVTASGTQTVNLNNLTASTTYYLHFVHSAAGLDSGVSNSASFTTNAATSLVVMPYPLEHALSGILANTPVTLILINRTNPSQPNVIKTGLTTDANGMVAGFSTPLSVGVALHVVAVSTTDNTVSGIESTIVTT